MLIVIKNVAIFAIFLDELSYALIQNVASSKGGISTPFSWSCIKNLCEHTLIADPLSTNVILVFN